MNIKTLSDAVGLNSHTIRAWERRYKALTPSRTGAGQRIYTLEDLERLRLLKGLVDHGVSISQVADLPLEGLKERLRSLVGVQQQNQAKPQMTGGSTKIDEKWLLRRLSSFDRDSIVEHLRSKRRRLTVPDWIYQIVLPILEFVGHKVQLGGLSIAHEHFVSAMIYEELALTAQELSRADKRLESPWLFATPSGDLHQIGTYLAYILCLFAQRPAIYLGPNIPVEPLVQAIKILDTKNLVLGCTVLSPAWGYRSLEGYLHQLGQKIPDTCHLLLGGGGFSTWTNPSPARQNIRVFQTLNEFETHVIKEE